jgi:hypothetical protein
MISKKDFRKLAKLSVTLKKAEERANKFIDARNNYAKILFEKNMHMDTHIAPMHNVLFENYRNKINNWNGLISENYYDKPFVPKNINRLISKYLSDYKECYDNAVIFREKHQEIYKQYYKLQNDLNENLKNAIESVDDQDKKQRLLEFCKPLLTKHVYCKGTKTPSEGELSVMEFLDKIALKCKLYYFYSHKWNFCKNKNHLEYDFYCVLLHQGCVFQWVIEYDGDQHYKDTHFFDFNNNHKRDILKQYYLAELNIHLLRLNKNLDIKKSIINFINKILITNKYVIVNKIDPIGDLFCEKSKHKGLVDFNKFIDDMKLHNEFSSSEEMKETKVPIITNFLNKNDIDAVKIPKPKFNINNESKSDESKSDESKSDESKEDDYIFLTDEIKKKYGIEVSEDIDEEEIYQIVYGDLGIWNSKSQVKPTRGDIGTSGYYNNEAINTKTIGHYNDKDNAICEIIMKILNNYHRTNFEENNISAIELFELIDDHNYKYKNKKKLSKQKPCVDQIKFKKKIMSKSNNKLPMGRKRGRYS